MKKFAGLALALVLVLALAGASSAADGKLGTISADINVLATIGPYAKIDAVSPVQFGELLGKVGIYTANGLEEPTGTAEQFYHRAAPVFGVSPDLYVGNNDGYGWFAIETNCDVIVSISFANAGWLTSPTVFGVAKFGEPSTVLAWASSNQDLGGRPTSFTHTYMKGVQKYGIDGAIYIRSISEQEAKAYSGTLTVTVSK
ncbi:MAG TPA: hypothetical protein GX393_02820 [Firmicutes bacterium]|jgi:hypothetical protein|nr:hypothetical protein [Bacillota bacterium]